MLIDITGNRYGKLTVLRRGKTKKRAKGTEVYWVCRCDCGNSHEVSGRSLRGGDSKSCGCNKPGPKPRTISTFNEIYSLYRSRAKRKGYRFALTKAQFKALIDSNCFYCGAKPGQVYRAANESSLPYKYNGIDRVDNVQGYTAENTVPACGVCNKAKNTMTQKEFYAWVDRVHALKLRSPT
jgi:hypothetical protein